MQQKKPRKPKVKKWQKVQVTDLEGKDQTIGEYNKEEQTFKAKLSRTEHFMKKYNAWGLNAKVVEFLSVEQACIIIKDTETKWEFKCMARDLILYGRKEELKNHLPQYFLELSHWEVTKAKDRSFVLECAEKDCRHNFANNCMRGTIKINEKGECANYEDR